MRDLPAAASQDLLQMRRFIKAAEHRTHVVEGAFGFTRPGPALPNFLRGRLLAQMSMPGGKSMMYAVVGPTPGISENTTLLRDSKEVC